MVDACDVGYQCGDHGKRFFAVRFPAKDSLHHQWATRAAVWHELNNTAKAQECRTLLDRQHSGPIECFGGVMLHQLVNSNRTHSSLNVYPQIRDDVRASAAFVSAVDAVANSISGNHICRMDIKFDTIADLK